VTLCDAVMTVRVHHAGDHRLAGGVDLAVAAQILARDGRDDLISDADAPAQATPGVHHDPVVDDQVVAAPRHGLLQTHDLAVEDLPEVHALSLLVVESEHGELLRDREVVAE